MFKGRSRAARHFYLFSVMPADNTDTPVKLSTTLKLVPKSDYTPPWNGTVHAMYSTIDNVMSSATEAEIWTVFKSCQACVSIRMTLIKVGHPQPPTPIEVDNQCDKGIFTDTIKQKRSKCMDMLFFWVRDRINQGQFFIY